MVLAAGGRNQRDDTHGSIRQRLIVSLVVAVLAAGGPGRRTALRSNGPRNARCDSPTNQTAMEPPVRRVCCGVCADPVTRDSKLKMPAWAFCMCWCPDFEFGGHIVPTISADTWRWSCVWVGLLGRAQPFRVMGRRHLPPDHCRRGRRCVLDRPGPLGGGGALRPPLQFREGESSRPQRWPAVAAVRRPKLPAAAAAPPAAAGRGSPHRTLVAARPRRAAAAAGGV